MVSIFSKTTTCLSDEFIGKLSADLLELTVENLKNIPGVQCEKQDDSVYLKGQWHDLVTAYISLEQCLFDKDSGESDKEDVKESVDAIENSKPHPVSSNESDRDVSPDIDYNFVTVKQEKDAGDWLTTLNQSSESTGVLDQDTDTDDKNEIKRKLRSGEKTIKRFKSSPGSPSNSKGSFKCNKCDYVGKKEKQLQSHIARKHQRPFKCDVCGKKYGYKTDLDRHKIEVHSKTANYYCNICDKYLKTKAYIDDHMSMHADNYVYNCKTCDKSFSTKQVFGKHMKQKHPSILFEVEDLDDVLPSDDTKSNLEKSLEDEASNDGTNTENGDDKSAEKSIEESIDQSFDSDYLFFPEEKEKIVHENNLVKVTLKRGKNRGRPRIKSYVDGRTEFPCSLCNYIGKKESHLEYHIIRNHSQKFICDICQKQFGYNWDLKRHREQVHAEASYICHICSKAYKVKKSFDEHLKSHEAGYVKSVYPCPQCEKSFSAKQVLENHIKIKHLGMKQKEKQKYLCQTCGAEFYHKYSYQSHMNKHAGLMPYNCDICGKAFASEHSVKEHQITHRDTREFHCHICPKSFKTSSALNAHVAIHDDKRDYKCSVCGKGFIQKQSLIRHERIHSGYKPFSCALCSRVFTDSATIRKHMILVHKSDPHDWQGDVISDLKKQGDMWQGDLTSEPKKEPDFRRKADRERHFQLEQASDGNSAAEQAMERQNCETGRQEPSQNSDGHFSREDSYTEVNQCSYNEMSQESSNTTNQDGSNSLQQIGPDGSGQSRTIGMSQGGEGMNSELKKTEFWRGDGYVDSHRPADAWQAGASRQPEQMRLEDLMELKRSAEYWPAGIVLDASRHSEYFHGDNIPDPRKQIEFWQGQTVPEQKQQNDQMQGQLTTLQNLNYSNQSHGIYLFNDPSVLIAVDNIARYIRYVVHTTGSALMFQSYTYTAEKCIMIMAVELDHFFLVCIAWFYTICKLSPKFLSSLSWHEVDKALEIIRNDTGVTVDQKDEFVSVLGDWDCVKNAHSYLEEIYKKEKSLKLGENCLTDNKHSQNPDIERAVVLPDGAVDEIVQNNDDEISSTIDSECKENSNSCDLSDIKLVSHYSEYTNTEHDAISENISESTDEVVCSADRCYNIEQGQEEHKDYLIDDHHDTDVDDQNLEESHNKQISSGNDILHEIKKENLSDETASVSLDEYHYTKNYNKAFEKSSFNGNGKELKCDIKIEKEMLSDDEASLSAEEILEDITKGIRSKQFTCQWCSKKFKNNSYLQRHIRCVHRSQGYCCKVCNKKYKQNSFRVYKKHIQTCKENDTKCKEYKCDKCTYTGKSKVQFTEHVARMHQNKLACGVCFKQFGLHKELQRHHHTVHSNQCYCCNICFKVYKLNSVRAYKKHLLTHGENHAIFSDLSHGIIEENENSDSKTKLKPVNIDEVGQCPDDVVDLQKQIQKLDDLSYMDEDTDIDEEYLNNINIKSVYNNGFQKVNINIPEKEVTALNSEQPKSGFYCLFCDKSYKSSREYRKHMSGHQEDYVELQYKCETCNKAFSTENVLKAHIEFQHSSLHSKNKSFICQVCNKEFNKRYRYLLHIEMHQGIKRYVCDICGKAFQHQKSFKEHKYVHEEVKQFSCHVCAKTFRQKSGLFVHLKTHSEFRDYICHTCGKGFTQRSSLVRHERVHTGDKPFQCALCSRSFNDYSIIRRHMIMLHKRDKDPRTWQADVIRSLKSSQNN
ncbi:zinc finger protein 729-like [Mercenaria mercenaria]|uniref:zinc finger protein 729-like n=1 Tax=Mercenaria mercenaria TaxID=6596 RepID=UPI00234EF0AF|nr:zinc finger protein 729-like [Mercenaria mercenaria]